jgi:hypothetical protein
MPSFYFKPNIEQLLMRADAATALGHYTTREGTWLTVLTRLRAGGGEGGFGHRRTR